MIDEDAVCKAISRELALNPNASISRLADKAGIGRTTFYKKFKSKESLAKIVIHKARDAILKAHQIADADYNDYIIGLHDILRHFCKNLEYFMLVESEVYHNLIERGEMHSGVSHLYRFLERGRKHGYFYYKAKPDYIASMMIGIVFSIFKYYSSHSLSEEQIEHLLLSGIYPILHIKTDNRCKNWYNFTSEV